MVFQNFQILKFEMADFDLAEKSKKIFVIVFGWKIARINLNFNPH